MEKKYKLIVFAVLITLAVIGLFIFYVTHYEVEKEKEDYCLWLKETCLNYGDDCLLNVEDDQCGEDNFCISKSEFDWCEK